MFEKQLEAFEKFKKLKVGALFMQMGTGKTRVAIELIDYNKCDLLVYIAPCSALSNIEKEFIKWGLKTHYILVGYETISLSDKKYLELLSKISNKKCFIVADESIFIKNDETKRFNRLCYLRNKCEYALILNGTPITKTEWDLYNQMYFLSPLILNMSRVEFQNKFFKKITYKKANQRKPNTFYKFSEVNAKVLYKLIEPYIFNAELDFSKNEYVIYNFVPYTDDNEYYEEKESKLKRFMETRSSEVIINMLTSLSVIASNYGYKNNQVIEYCKGKQMIVYCNYLSEISYISSRLDCFVITSDTPIKQREKIIEEFTNSSKPLIMTLGVGSYSLNLQFCNEIVYSSISFDYGKLEQSKYRIKRIGQEKEIKYTYFLTDLGINKLMLENLSRKQTLGELVKEKIMEGGVEWLKYI
ncbi:MAG: helicase-related protein [Alphaproteobacteria bacterium]|jgi:SNF2 family DNA or RNA helicase